MPGKQLSEPKPERTSDEAMELRAEAHQLRELSAELMTENRLLKNRTRRCEGRPKKHSMRSGDSDLIIHCADVGDVAVLEALQTLAPVRAIRGNNDKGL